MSKQFPVPEHEPTGNVTILRRYPEPVLQKRLEMRVRAFGAGAIRMQKAIEFYEDSINTEGSLTSIEAALLVLEQRMKEWKESVMQITCDDAEAALTSKTEPAKLAE